MSSKIIPELLMAFWLVSPALARSHKKPIQESKLLKDLDRVSLVRDNHQSSANVCALRNINGGQIEGVRVVGPNGYMGLAPGTTTVLIGNYTVVAYPNDRVEFESIPFGTTPFDSKQDKDSGRQAAVKSILSIRQTAIAACQK
jgi:hypothetical protein